MIIFCIFVLLIFGVINSMLIVPTCFDILNSRGTKYWYSMEHFHVFLCFIGGPFITIGIIIGTIWIYGYWWLFDMDKK